MACWLDYAVYYGRYSQLSCSAIRFGDFLSAHRLWFVFPIPYALQQSLPVLLQPRQGPLDGHPINSRRSLVCLYPLVRPIQIFSVQDSFQQICTIRFPAYPIVNALRVCQTSPGTHTFFPSLPATFTSDDSVQLLGFGFLRSLTLICGLVCDFCSSGRRFAHWSTSQLRNTASFRFHLTMDTLAFGYDLPTAGRLRDVHPIERALTGRTQRAARHKTVQHRLTSQKSGGLIFDSAIIYSWTARRGILQTRPILIAFNFPDFSTL